MGLAYVIFHNRLGLLGYVTSDLPKHTAADTLPCWLKDEALVKWVLLKSLESSVQMCFCHLTSCWRYGRSLGQNYKLTTFFPIFLLCDNFCDIFTCFVTILVKKLQIAMNLPIFFLCDNFCDIFACFVTFLVKKWQIATIFTFFLMKIFVARLLFWPSGFLRNAIIRQAILFASLNSSSCQPFSKIILLWRSSIANYV